MALRHKGLEFETVPWRFTEKEAIAFAGSSTVPVIVDGKQAIADSWRIALYLDEAYPQRPALFEGGQSRALSEFFASWAFRAVHPAVLKVILLDAFARRLGGESREVAAAFARLRQEITAAGADPTAELLSVFQYLGGRR